MHELQMQLLKYTSHKSSGCDSSWFPAGCRIGPSSSTCVCTLAMSAELQMLPVAKALVCNHKPLQLHGLVVCANLSGS